VFGVAGPLDPDGATEPEQVLIYPADLVAERYRDRDAQFLAAAHTSIVERVRQLRS
jgi:hypothetical protein